MAMQFGVWFDGRRPASKRDVKQEVSFLAGFGFDQVCILLNSTKSVTETWNDDILFWLLEELVAQGIEAHVMDWVWSRPDRLETQMRQLRRIEERAELTSYQMDAEEGWRDNKSATAAEAFIEAHQAEGCQTPVGVTAIANVDAPSQHDVQDLIRHLHRAGILHYVAPQAYSARSKAIPWTMRTDAVLPGRTQRLAHKQWHDLVDEVDVPVYLGMAGYGQHMFKPGIRQSLETSFQAALSLPQAFNVQSLWVWSRKHVRGMGKTATLLKTIMSETRASSRLGAHVIPAPSTEPTPAYHSPIAKASGHLLRCVLMQALGEA